MSDEILKEFDSKIYYAVTKIQNDHKRAEVNTINKEVIKTPIFKNITKDRLQDRVDKLLKNGTLVNKPNRDKDFLRTNRNKINDPSINISSLSTHSPPAASPTKLKEFLCLQQHHNSTRIHHHIRNCHILYLSHHLEISPWTLLQPVIATIQMASSNQR